MNSKTNGTSSKLNIGHRPLLIRTLIAILISNIFFYLLFMSSNETEAQEVQQAGWVQIQLTAKARTPFQTGKKVLLIDRRSGLSVEAVLEQSPSETDERITVSVKEGDAHSVLKSDNWEIVPYLKNLNLTQVGKRVEHEIRY
jgi:hypothetical protein